MLTTILAVVRNLFTHQIPPVKQWPIMAFASGQAEIGIDKPDSYTPIFDLETDDETAEVVLAIESFSKQNLSYQAIGLHFSADNGRVKQNYIAANCYATGFIQPVIFMPYDFLPTHFYFDLTPIQVQAYMDEIGFEIELEDLYGDLCLLIADRSKKKPVFLPIPLKQVDIFHAEAVAKNIWAQITCDDFPICLNDYELTEAKAQILVQELNHQIQQEHFPIKGSLSFNKEQNTLDLV